MAELRGQIAAEAPPDSTAEEGKAGRLGRGAARVFRVKEVGVLLALIVLVIYLSAMTPYFLTVANLLNVSRQMSLVAIVGVGVTFLIITQEFDLSLGSMFGLAGMVAALLVHNYGFNVWTTVPLVLLLGAFVGVINGLLSVTVGVPSFIVTLGMLSVLRGATLILAKGWPISDLPKSSFFSVFGGKILGAVPAQTLWMIGILVAGSFVLTRTVFGYHIYATGSNKKAARLSGINTDWVKIRNFVLVAVLASFAGLISLAYLNSVAPLTGQGMELDVIAAVVIGGTALFGGSGTILGTFLGAAIMSVVRNGLVLLRISAYWQEAVVGMVIVAAVVVDTVIAKRRHRG